MNAFTQAYVDRLPEGIRAWAAGCVTEQRMGDLSNGLTTFEADAIRSALAELREFDGVEITPENSLK